DSNPQPLPCKGSRLPLTYVPLNQDRPVANPVRTQQASRHAKRSKQACQAAHLSHLESVFYTAHSPGLYSSHESPSGIVTMSRLMKRRRILLRRVILLTTLAAIFPGWLTPRSQHAQVANQPQQKQRPRRVTDPNEPPPLWKLKKPDTPAAGDEVDEGDVVRVETQLVSVPAVVTDSSGRPLSGLKPENFQLIEDGQVQTITNFGTAETPFEIAPFLDTSGSTRDDVALI